MKFNHIKSLHLWFVFLLFLNMNYAQEGEKIFKLIKQEKIEEGNLLFDYKDEVVGNYIRMTGGLLENETQSRIYLNNGKSFDIDPFYFIVANLEEDRIFTLVKKEYPNLGIMYHYFLKIYDAKGNLIFEHDTPVLSGTNPRFEFSNQGNIYCSGIRIEGESTLFELAKFNKNGIVLWQKEIDYFEHFTKNLLVSEDESFSFIHKSIGNEIHKIIIYNGDGSKHQEIEIFDNEQGKIFFNENRMTYISNKVFEVYELKGRKKWESKRKEDIKNIDMSYVPLGLINNDQEVIFYSWKNKIFSLYNIDTSQSRKDYNIFKKLDLNTFINKTFVLKDELILVSDDSLFIIGTN